MTMSSRVGRVSEEDARASAFDVDMEAVVSDDFWRVPSDAAPRELIDLHKRLRRGGWGTENVETVYSYLQEPVEPSGPLPPVGPRKRWGGAVDTPYARFSVWIDGDYLADHPLLFEDLPRLVSEGVIAGWRIYADRGPLKGEEFGDDLRLRYPVVVKP